MAEANRDELYRQRRWAQLAIRASNKAGDVLPKKLYDLAGEKAPSDASKRTCRGHGD